MPQRRLGAALPNRGPGARVSDVLERNFQMPGGLG
jgi:hypothetical protein